MNEHPFWSYVERRGPSDCWPWGGARLAHGYGTFRGGPNKVLAHRFAYELLVGPIPSGLQIDHLCRNRACVNPEHLEAVTQQENIRRGLPFHQPKTHCKNGHPFDEVNTYRQLEKRGWRRVCRACNRAAVDRYQRTAS